MPIQRASRKIFTTIAVAALLPTASVAPASAQPLAPPGRSASSTPNPTTTVDPRTVLPRIDAAVRAGRWEDADNLLDVLQNNVRLAEAAEQRAPSAANAAAVRSATRTFTRQRTRVVGAKLDDALRRTYADRPGPAGTPNANAYWEATVGSWVRPLLVQFNRKYGPNGARAEVDAETERTIIEVTTGGSNQTLAGKVRQITGMSIDGVPRPATPYRQAGVGLQNDRVANPAGKRVIFYYAGREELPNRVVQALRSRGVAIARTRDELVKELSDAGEDVSELPAPGTSKAAKKAAKAEERNAENLGTCGRPAVGMGGGPAPVLAAMPMSASCTPQKRLSGMTQALQNPGGVDFTSLGLRYMSDDPGSGGVQYAFSGNAASPGITQNTDTGVDAVTNSTADLRTWLVLSPQTFWVNLNPSQPDKIVDAKLGKTNAGKALLEADLRLKQTSAKLLNPKTSLGARYWKALGNETCYSDRLWIIPGDVQVREDGSSLYVLRADLSVKTQTMNIDNVGSKSCHPDPDTAARMDKLERTTVLPKIIKAVNTEAGYAPLRRAFLARVVAQWIRDRHAAGHRTSFDDLLGSGDLGPATLTDGWRPRQVFDTYVHSVKDGAFTYKKTVRIGNRIYKQSETVGGVDFSKLNPSRIGAAQMNQQHPHLAQTVRNAASHPANDSDGTIWLGATAPMPDPGPWANVTGTIGDFVTSRTGILVLVVVALGVLTFGIRGGRRKRPAA